MSDHVEAPDSGADDLRAALSAAYDASDTPETQETHETREPTTPARDEHGRFARQERTETDHTDQPEAQAAEPETPAISPPQSWSDAEKAHWANLSREVQETVLRRERDYDKGLSDRADDLKAIAKIREVVAPYQAQLAMRGLSAEDALARLLAAEHMLHTNPDRAFPELARSLGYDLRRLIQPTQQNAAPQQAQQFRDPRVDEIQAYMQRQQHESALAQVESFGQDAAHPYFEEVRQHMGALVNAGMAKTLDEAYNQAIWAVPSVRDRMLADRAASERAQRDQEAKQKADAARRAAVSVRDNAAPSGGAQQAPANSIREELLRSFGAA